MNVRKLVTWSVVVVLVALLAWKLHTSHFDWAGFWHACRSVNTPLLLLAVGIIYAGFPLRAARWMLFVRPSLPADTSVRWYQLIGSQYIGFAALAALGRIGELVRPYLVGKRTGLSFPSQIAVVAVERIFDLGAFALIFSLNLLLSPQLNSLPYHERFRQMGFVVAALTAILIAFVVSVRLAGPKVAAMVRSVVGRFSAKAGETVEEKILAFRDGLRTINNTGDFVLAAVYSLLLWLTIAAAYIVVMRAFPSPVHDMTVPYVLLLMGFSVVGSVVQLPGIGGGAQALTIGALTLLFNIPKELASSAGLILWVIASMSVLPIGLLFAQLEHVSLRGVTEASEEATAAS